MVGRTVLGAIVPDCAWCMVQAEAGVVGNRNVVEKLGEI